jgi:hypothetical protein
LTPEQYNLLQAYNKNCVEKDTHPSKSSPHHCNNCFNLDLYFPPDCVDSPINAEYVEKITPFFTLLFTADEILAYFNCNKKKKKKKEKKIVRNEI